MGSTESFKEMNAQQLNHVGESEIDVGELAGKAMNEAGLKVVN